MLDLLSLKNERSLKSDSTHLHASYTFTFIPTWVSDNLIEKYVKGFCPPYPPLQQIYFCIPHATFWVVPKYNR